MFKNADLAQDGKHLKVGETQTKDDGVRKVIYLFIFLNQILPYSEQILVCLFKIIFDIFFPFYT